MKILFLDIDGVLNNTKQNWQKEGCYTIDDSCVEQLNKLLDDVPDLNIVLSSTWRIVVGAEKTVKHLEKHGFRHASRVIDRTPEFETVYERGDECLAWLGMRPILTDVSEWVIVDDCKEFFVTINDTKIRKRIVFTDKTTGMTEGTVRKIKNVLKVDNQKQ